MSSHSYLNPPIQEALVEVRFSEDETWNWTIPGRLWEIFRESYGAPPRSEPVFTLNAQQQAKKVKAQASGGVGRLFLTREDNSGLVAIAPNKVSIHVLAPYPGWDVFFGRIQEVLNLYPQVHTDPKIETVGLRYINRIRLPIRDGSLELGDWFTTSPSLPEEIGLPMTSLMSRIESHYPEEDVRLALTLATMASEDDSKGSFLLDVDLLSKPSKVSLNESVFPLIEKLHQKEKEAFEAMITDKTRKLFQ